ncbi:MAG: ATP-dependent 6-phosphofructokinase [Firmicutes bacterium]|nr:ATP-dependent 6-phosphofructokinase [Bacillota bacterium]
MKKIGILTSGGDAPGLNAAIRGVVKSAKEHHNMETIGFYFGFGGLIDNNFTNINDTSGFLTKGGTILKTSRIKPFKGEDKDQKLKSILHNYKSHDLSALVIIGGNGTQKTAYNLSKELGLNIITLPKTIDNDIAGTDVSFGFSSAVDIATEAIDRVHSTASSHNRVMIVEVMGHKAGWIGLHAGLSSGSDIILLPEIPFSFKKVYEAINKRVEQRKNSTIICVAEGAFSHDEIDLSPSELASKRKFRSIGQRLARKIEKHTPYESRLTVLGYVQRGGSPNAFDRNLATILGANVANLIEAENFGNMVGYIDNKAKTVPLIEVAGYLKIVEKENPVLSAARSIGISFGD